MVHYEKKPTNILLRLILDAIENLDLFFLKLLCDTTVKVGL